MVYFYVKITPLPPSSEKSHSLFPSNSPLKIKVLSKCPLFENWPAESEGGGSAHYVLLLHLTSCSESAKCLYFYFILVIYIYIYYYIYIIIYILLYIYIIIYLYMGQMKKWENGTNFLRFFEYVVNGHQTQKTQKFSKWNRMT